MDALSLTPPSKDSLQAEAQTWASKAAGLRIQDAASCIDASHFLRSIKGIRSDIQRWFEPHVEAAMATKRKAEEARKALTDERDRMEAPLVAAEQQVKRALLAYETEQEQQRLEEQRRLQAEANRRAEAIALEAAAVLERQANAAGDAGMLQEAHELLAQPTEAPVVIVKPSMPKVQGVMYRDNWKASEQVDVRALARAVGDGSASVTYLTPNMTALNQTARATQGTQPVPGVKFYNDRQIAAKG